MSEALRTVVEKMKEVQSAAFLALKLSNHLATDFQHISNVDKKDFLV